jgi:calcium-dependent protein kinase
LVVDPLKRPTAQQAKESKWLKMCSNNENDNNGGEDSMINPNVVNALVGFREYSDMQKLLCEVMSFTLLPEQIQGLRKEFEKYDKEGIGEISLSTLKNVLIGNASTGKLGYGSRGGRHLQFDAGAEGRDHNSLARLHCRRLVTVCGG